MYYAQKDWEEIDDLVADYQKIFLSDAEVESQYNPDHLDSFNIASERKLLKTRSQDAVIELIERFYPLLKKYLSVVKSGQINFGDMAERLFVALFLGDTRLKRALYGQAELTKDIRSQILQRFNFIKETYGHLENDDIMLDLKMLLLVLAKRYKRSNRSFCCYVANTYRYELFRHIQKFNKNPLNIHYKNLQYEDAAKINTPDLIDDGNVEDKIYKNDMGLPDLSWIAGESCSDAFSVLTPEERKIIVKYYLEHMCDRQIADRYGLHVNTCNQKRRNALNKLADYFGVSYDKIRRSRNSGKKSF